MLWKYALASVTGTAHTEKSLPCADVCYCFTIEAEEEILVVVAADGAGSAKKGESGSALACRLFAEEIRLLFSDGGSTEEITREFAGYWVLKLQNEIKVLADADGATVRDYACTFIGGVVGQGCAAFLQVGDGAIVIDSHGEASEYRTVFWPQHGEYANQTTFVTDEIAFESFQHQLFHQPINEVAIFTDGLERLVLDFQNSKAHSPFFEAMFKPMRNERSGHSDSLSFSLVSFLDSPKVNDRSFDDKTLILATRLS